MGRALDDRLLQEIIDDDELYYLVYDEFKSSGWKAIQKALPEILSKIYRKAVACPTCRGLGHLHRECYKHPEGLQDHVKDLAGIGGACWASCPEPHTIYKINGVPFYAKVTLEEDGLLHLKAEVPEDWEYVDG